LLTQGGLGTIFSDIIKDNPTIKNKVGEHAFRYIISGLGSVCCFTNSYKQMCGCMECVGLHTLHRSLLAKCGVMHSQFAVDSQHCTHAAKAAKKASGWAAVAWHPKPLLAITEGTCQRWSLHAVPHWECQMLQCSNCKEYPVPKEEAREDRAAEDISFHVYEYKVSLRKDGKECRWMELCRSARRLASSIACTIGLPLAVGGTIPPATCWQRAVGGIDGQSRAVASAATATMVRGCRSLSTRRFRAATTKIRLLVSRERRLSGSAQQVRHAHATLAPGQTTPSRTPPRQRIICIASCALTDLRCSLSRD
jgi:hypothetical protein